MNTTEMLENLDLESLDAFEFTVYNDYTRHMSKTEALQIIINNAEGDFTQLSDNLVEIAQLQDYENE